MNNYSRNDIKITFNTEPVFYINEEKKTVACRMSGTIVGPKSTYWGEPNFVCNSDISACGVAKCTENDVFDVNRGKRIALAKAENKIYLTALKRLEYSANSMRFLLETLDNFSEKVYGCCAHNEDYIESLSYPAHPKYQKEILPPKRGIEV